MKTKAIIINHVIPHFENHIHKYLVGIVGIFFLKGIFSLILGLQFFGFHASANFDDPALTCSGVIEIPESECVALLNFYNDTNGDSWSNNENWGNTGAICDNWFGVECSGSNIYKIDLHKVGGLSGSANFSGLANLSYLDLSTIFLSDNNLDGIDLSNNINLETLDLTNNNLDEIDLSNNINLETLNLGFNNLSGIDISNKTGLVTLDLMNNNLDEIDLSNNTGLTYLNLSDNNLSGIDLSNNTGLTYLNLSDNNLSGIDLSNNIDLSNLDLSYNAFVDIFPSISFNEIVPSLINLDISGNPMDTTLEDIDICNIYDDYFNTGGDSTNTFVISGAGLHGEIPACLSSLTNKRLFLDYNYLDIYDEYGEIDITGDLYDWLEEYSYRLNKGGGSALYDWKNQLINYEESDMYMTPTDYPAGDTLTLGEDILFSFDIGNLGPNTSYSNSMGVSIYGIDYVFVDIPGEDKVRGAQADPCYQQFLDGTGEYMPIIDGVFDDVFDLMITDNGDGTYLYHDEDEGDILFTGNDEIDNNTGFIRYIYFLALSGVSPLSSLGVELIDDFIDTLNLPNYDGQDVMDFMNLTADGQYHYDDLVDFSDMASEAGISVSLSGVESCGITEGVTMTEEWGTAEDPCYQDFIENTGGYIDVVDQGADASFSQMAIYDSGSNTYTVLGGEDIYFSGTELLNSSTGLKKYLALMAEIFAFLQGDEEPKDQILESIESSGEYFTFDAMCKSGVFSFGEDDPDSSPDLLSCLSGLYTPNAELSGVQSCGIRNYTYPIGSMLSGEMAYGSIFGNVIGDMKITYGISSSAGGDTDLSNNTGFFSYTVTLPQEEIDTTPIIYNPPIGGGGGGVILYKDECPDGDCSESYYDEECDEPHSSAPEDICEVNSSNYSNEIKSAYVYGYTNGMTTMCPVDKADLDGYLKRNHLAKMISAFAINVMGKTPEIGKEGCSDFTDISDETPELQRYIKTACELGLMGLESDGITVKTKFNGERYVNRAEFGTTLSRLIYGDTYNIDGTNDEGFLWYSKHLNKLKEEGIMTHIIGAWPRNIEVRSYALTMLMRYGIK